MNQVQFLSMDPPGTRGPPKAPLNSMGPCCIHSPLNIFHVMPLGGNQKLTLSESQPKPADGKQDEESPTSPTLCREPGQTEISSFC